MFKTTCTTFLILVFASQLAFAKSGKYDRGSGSSATTATDAAADPSKGDSAKASTKPADSSAPAAPGASGDKKVDLTDLENRYWTAKDTEFNVVQNRLYTKAHRFALNFMLGTDLSSNYTNDYNIGLQLSYYFSERQGVTLQGWKTAASPASFATTFEQNGAAYNYNSPTGYIGANYNWVPIYAKISLLEKKILYFDMSINPGLGATFLYSNSFGTTVNQPNSLSQTAITGAIDISQQVFLSSHWAIKLDIDSHFYPETIYYAGGGLQPANSVAQNKLTYSAIFMLGVTFFQ
jgi:outer membrane beta-barrel protein